MYEIRRLPQFDDWFKGLNDSLTKKRLIARLTKAALGNLGDVKPVGEGVFEMREHFGGGLRMYYTLRNGTLILMLGGGDKSTQSKDIEAAKALTQQLEI